MNRWQTAALTTFLAVLGVAGIAFAVGQSEDVPTAKPAEVTRTLAEGQAESGRYTVSAVDMGAPKTLFCYEITTEQQRGQGCAAVPPIGEIDADFPKPRRTLLGTDRFASLLAPEGVEGMRVVDPDGELVAKAQAVSVDGVGRLLIAAWGGPQVGSNNPDPDRALELLNKRGDAIAELPFPGFGK